MLWAALTVGKAGVVELSRHGVHSRYERLMRMHLLKANWKVSASGMFQHSEVYKCLDSSEKTAISYFAGLTVAKLLAHECLQVAWLQHYDGYLRSINQVVKGKRPDLVGVNTGRQWFALEAKGRSRGVEADLMKNALEQADAVKPINGTAPLPIASIAYTKQAGSLYATWEDPEPEQPNEAGYQIDELDFLQKYYQPIRSLINAESPGAIEETHGNLKYTVRQFPDLDVRVGILNESESFIFTNSRWYENLTEFLPRINAMLEIIAGKSPDSGVGNRDTFIGRDGILVSLGPSWSDENMLLEVAERPVK